MATYEFSNAIPYAPTHVGELINDELVASGLSVEYLATIRFLPMRLSFSFNSSV